jgi:hypothetical protein
MTTDIDELLRGLKLYIGVPLTTKERATADRIYAQVVVWCKERRLQEDLTRVTLRKNGMFFEDDEDSKREVPDRT